MYLQIDHHWYGNYKRWLLCPKCKGEDFDIVGWVVDNVVSVRCKKCGCVTNAEYS